MPFYIKFYFWFRPSELPFTTSRIGDRNVVHTRICTSSEVVSSSRVPPSHVTYGSTKAPRGHSLAGGGSLTFSVSVACENPDFSYLQRTLGDIIFAKCGLAFALF